MGFERTHSFQKQKSYIPQPTIQLRSRPFAAPIQMKPKEQQTPEELANQAFNQNKFEAFGLQLKEERGTITPVEQEQLGLLQVKMNDYWEQNQERASRSGFDFSKVAVTLPGEQAAPQIQAMGRLGTPGVQLGGKRSPLNSSQQLSEPPIQAKLTIGEPGDKYEQEADRVAAQVINCLNSPTTLQPSLGKTVQQNRGAIQRQLQPQPEGKLVTHVNHSPTLQRAKTVANDVAGVARNELFGDETARRNTLGGGLINPNAIATQAVSIQSTNGNTLTGKLYRPVGGGANTTVLTLSGSGSSAEDYMTKIAREYVPAGAQVLAINYRGFGDSYKTVNGPGGGGGDPSEAGLYEDAEAMYDYVRNTLNVPSTDIIVHGYSLGSPVAATLVKRVMKSRGENVKALILDRAMPSTYKAAKAKGSNEVEARIGQALAGDMDTKAKLKKILSLAGGANLPILFTSGGAADVLSAEDQALAAWAGQNNKFGNNATSVVNPNADHEDHRLIMNMLIPELQVQGLI
ncbi:alpha/beta hydrolase [Coleofasciculus sp. FACHB-SPT36]|uniref:alpha/beta hydrolase n=1 Tax=Cyanophyceae TaxID=3028117 RepID=UPI00168BC3FF|nr:alpha/beta hydrolase [Coleofasciculus sp. FACHB-SPT36]MBD2539360.1 alpha/beta hydrolase [Coleofasciculus sp. FACHB-SPT36]